MAASVIDGAVTSWSYGLPVVAVSVGASPFTDIVYWADGLPAVLHAEGAAAVPVAIPDLAGLTEAAASAALVAADLTVGTITTSYHASVPVGQVISQSPAAGVFVLPGTAVDFVVSLGPVPTTVPNVLGLTLTAATTAITGASLVVGTVSELAYPGSGPLPGLIGAQSPTGGTGAFVGDDVDVSVVVGGLRVTQVAVEIFFPYATPARLTQLAVEVFFPREAVVRSSQQAVEWFNVTSAALRVTQEPVEIFLTLPLPGRLIRRLRRAPHVHDPEAHRRITYARFTLDLQRGTDRPPMGQGSEPHVTLRLSRDGGKTWSEPVRMHAGRLHAYTTRVLARRLGHARDAVFEVTVSDPIAWSLVQAWLDLDEGTS